MVDLFISTNGRDQSSNCWPFEFKITPVISSIAPLWVLANTDRVLTVTGEAFFSPEPLSNFRLTSNTDSTKIKEVDVTYVSETELTFGWPAGTFSPGEQITVSLTLEGTVYTSAPSPLTSYGEITLGRVRPPMVFNADETS
mmetsp:Transcript_135/g.115  ORF Transcript_135/g.115 Transcript_135/m.115 type:complete len:141 (-) Transcript_135:6851-7273(-)